MEGSQTRGEGVVVSGVHVQRAHEDTRVVVEDTAGAVARMVVDINHCHLLKGPPFQEQGGAYGCDVDEAVATVVVVRRVVSRVRDQRIAERLCVGLQRQLDGLVRNRCRINNIIILAFIYKVEIETDTSKLRVP